MRKDNLFKKRKNNIMNFDFGAKTAAVFDDMLIRSVPLYNELQHMIGEITSEFAQDKTNIYDVGCSTGTTLITIDKIVRKNVSLIGVDYSRAMLDKCRERFKKERIKNKIELVCGDLNDGVNIHNASVVILNLTLQFVRPLYRDNIIRNIYAGLNEKGCLILVEKVLGDDSTFNSMFIKFYYEMKKRNGYTETEIAHKREALENVLIPYRLDENKQLLMRNGFSCQDIFYKWYNFCGIVAIK
ncbi:MAG: carboxy-S-adenosyl-L-methionine synthase CmoA [Candidatus Omnitrophota bacterium]|nr:carboxy-S-adenosyl-L-methionine synthase CmoA [Candidatus Omnitrophota bacterium]